MWEFFLAMAKQYEWLVPVFVGLVLFSVFQFARGNWRFAITKEGKKVFTTSASRTAYDVNKTMLKRLEQHEQNDGKIKDEVVASLEQVSRTIQAVTSKLDAVARDTNKGLFYSDTLPGIDRIYAGFRYLETGGNSTVHEDFLAFCKDRPDAVNAILYEHPRWKELYK